MADKVYEPEVVQENPFPTDTSEEIGSSNDGVSGDNYSNTQTRQTTTPKKRVSTELLSTSLNTRSRKVLQNFELQQSGGFQVGNFKEGVSGDLRITPNGLTARDQAGNTSFAIDGTTGDATFKGTVQADSVVAATIYAANLADDITFFTQRSMTVNERVSLDPNFETLDELTINLTSSKNGKILMMANLGVVTENEGEDFYLRYKITENDDISYYPNSVGMAMWSLRYIADIGSGGTAVASLPWIADIGPGNITIEVQGSTDAASQGNNVRGAASFGQRSTFLIQIIGSEIEEL